MGWEITKEISFFSILSTHLLQIKVLLGQGKIFWLHRRYLEGHEGPPHYQHRHRPDRSLHFVSLPVQPVSFCHLSKHDQNKQEKTQLNAQSSDDQCVCAQRCVHVTVCPLVQIIRNELLDFRV